MTKNSVVVVMGTSLPAPLFILPTFRLPNCLLISRLSPSVISSGLTEICRLPDQPKFRKVEGDTGDFRFLRYHHIAIAAYVGR